ncbi:L,D-transpeptidase [Sphingomonas zeae]
MACAKGGNSGSAGPRAGCRERRPSGRRTWAGALLIGAALGLTGPVQAQDAVPGPIERMQAGDALMAPQLAPDGPVTILVSLPLQRAYVYRNGIPVAVSTVSTGRSGHATPTGIFTILQKDADHRSNKYDDAPMPYMQRLTWDGIALHAGTLPGYPASHGCIRLPVAFARWLFSITRLGATVVVTDTPSVPEISPVAAPLAPPAGDARDAGSAFTWRPERAPSGPVSLVLSGRDRRLLVLRNGVEIGNAPILLDQPVSMTAAFQLQSIDASGPHWLRLPVPGLSSPSGTVTSAADETKVHLPDGFRSLVMGVLQPGATLLVTRDTLASAGTGMRQRVIDTGP